MAPHPVFTGVLGIRSQALMLAQQILYLLSLLPSQSLGVLIWLRANFLPLGPGLDLPLGDGCIPRRVNVECSPWAQAASDSVCWGTREKIQMAP